MKKRRTFSRARGVSGASFEPAGGAEAQTPVPAPLAANAVPETPRPDPRAKTDAKPPSAAAHAVALTMRRFDSNLTDAQIETIAVAIEAHNAAGASLNPMKKRLRNSDEPVTTFLVAVPRA